MPTKRRSIVLVRNAVIAFAVSVTMTPLVATAEDAVRIGFYGPLTGPTAQAGQALRNGALLAIDEINAAGGISGKKFTLVEYDDRSSPEQAVRSATKLVQVDHVAAIVGSLHSGNVLAAGPVIEEFQTPLVGAGTSPTWLQKGYRYFFRALGNSELSGQQLVKYAGDHQLKKIAAFHSNDEYGNSGTSDFVQSAKLAGLNIVLNESFTHGDRDFTGQIGKVVRAAPDAVFIWALGDDLGPVTKQLRQLGYAGTILGPEGYTLPEALKIAGTTADGVVFASQYLIPKTAAEAKDPMMKSFLTAYETKFGSMPASDNAFRGYDAVKIIAEGIRASGSIEGPKIRDAINAISGFKGIAGSFTFAGKQGEGIDTVRLYQIKNSGYSEVQ